MCVSELCVELQWHFGAYVTTTRVSGFPSLFLTPFNPPLSICFSLFLHFFCITFCALSLSLSFLSPPRTSFLRNAAVFPAFSLRGGGGVALPVAAERGEKKSCIAVARIQTNKGHLWRFPRS